ncbi:MAG TPA: hypothetical protein VGF45_03290 [Polyangia bacterium]
MSLRRTGEGDAGSETTGGGRHPHAGADANTESNPASERFDPAEWSAEEVAWFRRGIPRRWQGPRGRVALAGLFVLAAGYWGTVSYLVSGRLAAPQHGDCARSDYSTGFDFDGYDLRPVPGTIPFEWESGTGGTSGPRPLGLATGVPHSLLVDRDRDRGIPIRLPRAHELPGYRPFGPALGYPRALGESALVPLDTDVK